MVGRDRGFVAFIEGKIDHLVMKFQCIIHEESRCAKTPNSNLTGEITYLQSFRDVEIFCSQTQCLYSKCSKFPFRLF